MNFANFQRLFFAFFATRPIIKGNPLALRARAIDNQTNEPVKNVFFRIQSNGGSEVQSLRAARELVKKTSSKGGFYVKNLPEGSYIVSVSKQGYKEKVITATVANGELTELMVKIEKN